MTELQKEFEKMGCVSWINSSLYPDSKYYTEAYTLWLEKKLVDLRGKLMPELSDEEIEKSISYDSKDPYVEGYINGAKWYREQLKQRQ